MINTTVKSKEGGSQNIRLSEEPNSCPFCHHTIVPIRLGDGYITPQAVEILHRCANEECQKAFIAYYKIRAGHGASSPLYDFQNVSTGNIRLRDFSEIVNLISPNFSIIYYQALKAEAAGLDQLSGMGFRKSIEFLIKDYIINEAPDLEEVVKAKLLGPCINDYVSNEKVKEVAKRAVWIGNDETHYVRRWEGKDIEDLKTLIEITIHWIEMEKLTADYLTEMS